MRLKILDHEINYRLVRRLAEGGMGIVYEGQQHGVDKFSKTVAIKLIREEYSNIKEFRSNFIGEAKLVADHIHTNIVQTYHLGEIEGQYSIIMEYVNGINLEEFHFKHLSLGIPVPVDLAVFIVSRICRGLAYAHSKCEKEGQLLNIVHRDVNPKNIMGATKRFSELDLTPLLISKGNLLLRTTLKNSIFISEGFFYNYFT